MSMDWSKLRPTDEPNELGMDLILSISDEFLRRGRGTPDQKLRVSLGRDRRALDQLVQAGYIRNVGNKYYPTFKALYFDRGGLVPICEHALERVFLTIKRLYERDQLSRCTLNEITKTANTISNEYISAEDIRIASQFLRDFPGYFNNFDSSAEAPVSAVFVSENILDFEGLEQSWEDELDRRKPLSSPTPMTTPEPRPTGPKEFAAEGFLPDLSFVSDEKLRRILERDYLELIRVRSVSASKSRLILAGGLIEGLLLDGLERPPRKALQAKLAEKDRNGNVPPLSDWSLVGLIRVASELGFISTGTQKMCDFARDFRNLIHPDKERSGDYVVGTHEASGAESAVHAVIRDLSERLPD
jgi:hypothetical protein